jgi:hypothetical protein
MLSGIAGTGFAALPIYEVQSADTVNGAIPAAGMLCKP